MEILYSDKQIVVCVKPVGMDSEHEVPQALGGEVFPIHRLDKNVGGVMVYARNEKEHSINAGRSQVQHKHRRPPRCCIFPMRPKEKRKKCHPNAVARGWHFCYCFESVMR